MRKKRLSIATGKEKAEARREKKDKELFDTPGVPEAILESQRKRAGVEKSKVKVAVYPRTGDNPDFEGVLDRVGLEAEKAEPKKQATQSQPDKPAAGDEILTVADVAEWIGAPFGAWAVQNELGSLALTASEATSIAEPVTAILNRHGISRLIPPDWIDGLRVGARLSPVLQDRLQRIKKERQRRAAAGGGDSHEPAPVAKGAVKVQQGADATTPKEI